ncbi:hypothetical protein [Colwellia sp. MB02u-14]|uniref:hypothetical protein n=1 Tax=Colwellia sp. MB02u-14 TaxID=2759815 RepID=UPI0015F75F62|nr:hypothetical protein [Colwellia sp. MB02u-14]MBA6302541.1 hypothetical protein [Colwellia sp. MB02u-14]
MLERALIKLFKDYISAFEDCNLAAARACYHLPCTLHTPDKIAYLVDSETFNQEFENIFTVLKHANTQKIVPTIASYNQSANGSVDICIDWAFIDNDDEIYADFTAFFHIVKIAEAFKIVSVVSHDLTNSVELAIPLVLVR